MTYYLNISDVELIEEYEASYTTTETWWMARVTDRLKSDSEDRTDARSGPSIAMSRTGKYPDEAMDSLRDAMAKNGWELR